MRVPRDLSRAEITKALRVLGYEKVRTVSDAADSFLAASSGLKDGLRVWNNRPILQKPRLGFFGEAKGWVIKFRSLTA